ncbi:MAG: dTMP kinase [bacterium]|nr:dTMP kinase [bacterium]
MAKRGKFIVVDGGEGSGKSTLMNFLPEILSAPTLRPEQAKFLATREPGGSVFAEEIRNLMLTHEESKAASPETQFGLVWAARHDHLTKKIIPALENGIHVISDRFDSSTYAYQVYGQEAPYLEKLFWDIRKIYLREQQPDLYIFLDIDPALGLGRVAARRKEPDHFDQRQLSFHKRIRQGYLKFMKKVPSVIIDTGGTVEEAKKKFSEALKRALC